MISTKKIVSAIAAVLLVSAPVDAAQVQVHQQSAAELVAEAMSHVETGSSSHTHLGNALSALARKTDAEVMASHTQLVTVPIDEKRALTLKVSPTYVLDEVQSVTLKSFRKIVGYDTFESIRKKDRDERKDISDYYNVTTSMLIRRKPEETAPPPMRDVYNPEQSTNFAATLDKGFPYDDQDQSV